jgi:hypothetical protein
MGQRPNGDDIAKKASEELYEELHIKYKADYLSKTDNFVFTQVDAPWKGAKPNPANKIVVFLSKTRGAVLPPDFNSVEFAKRRKEKKDRKTFDPSHFESEDMTYVNVKELLAIAKTGATSVKDIKGNTCELREVLHDKILKDVCVKQCLGNIIKPPGSFTKCTSIDLIKLKDDKDIGAVAIFLFGPPPTGGAPPPPPPVPPPVPPKAPAAAPKAPAAPAAAPSMPPSAPPAAAATGPSEDTIKKGIISLYNLKGNVESTTQGELVDEIRKFLQISNCAQLFGAVSVNGDISSKVEDYSNIFQIYFELTNQEEDENKWKKIDDAYEKIIAKYYELVANLSIQRGGIRPGLKATNIFNTSANTINANNVQKIDDKIRKLLSELQRNKEYIDRLYSTGTLPTPAMIRKIEEETTRIETSAKTLITDRENLVSEEGPESMFKNLLNKFKTEAQLISWLEKAKIENIEITAKYKAANQKFKSLSTIKKTVDKYIENMKKTLNSKCLLIQDYSRLVDNAKPLELAQQNILELHALRLDPARGTNSIQLLLEKLQITPDEFIDRLKKSRKLIEKYIEYSTRNLIPVDIRESAKEELSSRTPPATDSEIEILAKKDLQKYESKEKVDFDRQTGVFILSKLPQSLFFDRFKVIVEDLSNYFSVDDVNISNIKEISEKYMQEKNMTRDRLYSILTGGMVFFQKFYEKYIIVATMIKAKSWKPITDEIFKKKQESEKLLSEINDRIEEVKEREQAPVDNSTYFNLYKTTMKEEEDTLKSEVAKIEAETVILLKKVPEEIAKIKEAAKVIFQQPNNNQNQSQDFKNFSLQKLKDTKREYEAKIKLITDKGLNVSKSERKELQRYKGQIPNLDKLISQKEQGTTAAAPGGGKRVYAHSTRRHIR